jgi:hypothetical protein
MAPKVSAVRDDLVADTHSPVAKTGSKTDKLRILRLSDRQRHAPPTQKTANPSKLLHCSN